MNKYFLLICLLIFKQVCSSQNLVPNPDFEQTISCNYPSIVVNQGEYPLSIDTSEFNTISLTNWFTYSSPDYFNKCNSRFPYNYYKFLPRNGNGYVGIISITRYDSTIFPNFRGVREFIETKLLEPLHAGCTYQISFYARLNPTPHAGVSGVMGIDGMGMYLSENRMNGKIWYSYEPQIKNPDGSILSDTSRYVEVKGLYTATGGEKYISIGNFKTDSNTAIQVVLPHHEWGISGAYYLIDDVSIIPIETVSHQLDLGKDTVLCNNSHFPFTLSASFNFDNYLWSTGESARTIQIISPGTYWVKAHFGCGYLTDTITIYRQDDFENEMNIGKDTIFCNEIPSGFSLEVSKGPYTINWSTNDTQDSILINSEGVYWVDLTNYCGTISDTISIRIEPTIRSIFLGKDSIVCNVDDLSLELKIDNTFESYLWSTGETSSSVRINKPGSYWVTSYFQCGFSTDTILLSTREKPVPILKGIDTTFCEGTVIDYTISGISDKFQYEWELSKTHSLALLNSGVYRFSIFNECFSVFDSIQAHFISCDPFIPNLISVNNDGKNELFEIVISTNNVLHLEIYNRWGQQIYYSDNYKGTWPDDSISSGLYYYFIKDRISSKEYTGWIQVTGSK